MLMQALTASPNPRQVELLQLQEALAVVTQSCDRLQGGGGGGEQGRGEAWMEQAADLQEDVAGLLATASAR